MSRTALRRRARLEAEGVWRDGSGVAGRRVGVSLGEVSLTIAADGHPLAHWSLPALERVGRAEPARYAPSGGRESLEIADVEMVAAIERIRRALARPPRRRLAGRLVLAVALGLAALALGAALPGLVRERTASALPPEMRRGLGEALLARLGRPCAETPALDALARRLEPALGPGARIVAVEGPPGPVALPGALVALPPRAIGTAAEPGVAVGRVLTAAEAAGPDGPLGRLLAEAGTAQTLRLLVSARISEGALDAHAARLLAEPAARTPPGELVPGILARFDAAGLSSTPYGRASRVPALVALDPHPGAAPALPDQTWIALQSLCEA